MEQQKITIPVAIIIAGVLIAGAVIFSNRSNLAIQGGAGNLGGHQAPEPEGSTDLVRKVTQEDHIKGDINAPVKVVEYSDFECPFCRGFHETMNRVMAEYGEDGQVAWVYRHFPLDQLHPVKARREAVASECASELGGNDGFWGFADRFFELTPSNNQTNIDVVLPQIVRELGLDENAFNNCLDSGKYDSQVEDDIQNSIDTGGRGTPWSVVIGPDGTTYPLSGAQPYETVKQLIDIALSDN